MRNVIFFFGLIGLFSSCREKTDYELQIGIDNLTEEELHFQVLPKTKYADGEDDYKFTYDGSIRGTLFSIPSDYAETLFITDNMNYKPQGLLSDVFDSLIITINTGTAFKIKFNPDGCENYRTNMFAENTNWIYTKIKDNRPTNFKKIL